MFSVKENDFILLGHCLNDTSCVVDGILGFHVIKLEQICYAGSHNFPCVRIVPLTLLNSWLHSIMDMKWALHGQSYAYDFATFIYSAKPEHSLTLLRLGWGKSVSLLLRNADRN